MNHESWKVASHTVSHANSMVLSHLEVAARLGPDVISLKGKTALERREPHSPVPFTDRKGGLKASNTVLIAQQPYTIGILKDNGFLKL